ncbi:MAG TPA: VWA domain-containing protein [Clostridia bacterium]|nr:VWA domain-containing protein [Clostridia bacterium]
MVIDFERPFILFLIPLAILFVLYTARKLGKMYSLRKKLILFLRNSVFVLLILALSGVNIKWIVDTTTTIFVVDASDSMKEYRTTAEEFVRKALNRKESKDQSGVVAFGDNSLIESFVSRDSVFNKIETEPKGIYTDIENALTTSVSLLPQDSRKRIVLITDGEENEGNSSRLASSIISQGIDFKVYRIERETGKEAAIESITVPRRLRVGEEFSIVVVVESTVQTGAKLTLVSGRDKAAEERVVLQKGSNRFVFRDQADAGGFKSYKVLMEPDIDTESRNNEASTFTDIIDRPKILVVEDSAGEADEVIRMLEATGMSYVRVNARSVPGTLEGLSAYKSIITCNVSAENFNDGFLSSLDSYVKDMGGGFIATGGENSYALGGYYKTALEKVLPVEMELKGKKEIPDMSIVLIIDKSGSMTEGSGGIMKLDLAKEAAARTLDSLRPNDQIGVLTFDDTNYWVIPTRKADDAEKIRDDIGTIRPGGGTSIIPALQEGYTSIKNTNTKIKHIILLTDGQAERTGYMELVEKLKEDNITVSTVAVGQGSDVRLLEDIAKGAGGRFYYTDEFSNIPRIFAKETFIAARAYLNNREFVPAITNAHPVLAGAAEEGLPSLLGYVAATPKSTSRVVLASDQEDPILTVWQYGLGKTAAWNSDINGKWSKNYVGWENNIKLWQNLINWTIEKYQEDDITVETEVQGGKGVITLNNKVDKGEFETKATIVSPSMESREVTLYPAAPGQYSGDFDITETGAYIIKTLQQKGGEVINAASTGISVQYSPEYRLQPASGYLDRLVKEAGGIFISTPEEVYKGELKDIFGAVDLTPSLIILALILFMLDIALRRLNLPLAVLEDKLNWLRSKFGTNWKESAVSKKKVMLKQEITVQQETRSESISSAAGKKSEAKGLDNKVEKPKAENLDTSALLKKKKNREG